VLIPGIVLASMFGVLVIFLLGYWAGWVDRGLPINQKRGKVV